MENTKQRLFEMISKLDKSFKPKLTEEFTNAMDLSNEPEPELYSSRAMLYYYPKFRELIQQMLQNGEYSSNMVLKIVTDILKK